MKVYISQFSKRHSLPEKLCQMCVENEKCRSFGGLSATGFTYYGNRHLKICEKKLHMNASNPADFPYVLRLFKEDFVEYMKWYWSPKEGLDYLETLSCGDDIVLLCDNEVHMEALKDYLSDVTLVTII